MTRFDKFLPPAAVLRARRNHRLLALAAAVSFPIVHIS